MEGYIGEYKQISYPKEWLTCNRINNIGETRQILVVPNSNVSAISINAALFAGSIIPQLGLVNTSSIGSYWKLKYITGFDFDHIPYDIMDVVGKFASLNLFNILGDIILGAGIASQSLSIDGSSQSIASTASATNAGYGARIITYAKQIDESVKRLKGVYKGISLIGI